MKDRNVNASSQVPRDPRFKWLRAAVVVLLTFGSVLGGTAVAQPAAGRVIAGNTPRFASTGKDLGREDASKTITVTLWLQPHNRAFLDRLAEQLYDKPSPNYRHWLKPAELKAQFAPTDEEVKTVKQFLLDHNLRFSRVGPANFSVTAKGTVAEVEDAFSVEIHRFTVGSETRRANINDPVIEGPAGAVVAAVYGLDDNTYKNPVHQASDLLGSKPASSVRGTPLRPDASSTEGSLFLGPCFTGVETESFATNGALPFATYQGNGYGAQAASGQAGLPCGYTPRQIYTAYHLNGLYAKGFKGQGQTIVIINFLGAPTVIQDANLFNSLNDLPSLTPKNFNIMYYPFNCNCGLETAEIDLDVEWSHAIAPAANIVVLIAPSMSLADADNATVFAIIEGLGNTISGSFGAEERILPAVVLDQENLIAELAAVSGISTNYSSGDSGGQFDDLPSTIVPGGVPFATSVGGVSLALNNDNTIDWQSGWGLNQTGIIGSFNSFVADPPVHFGFRGGSGGGASGFFAKPKFQRGVPGTFRQTPDISWLADPLTGGEEVLFDGFGETVTVAGGTSLAAPMFSGLWAIANQEAGEPLGQAASYLYSMPVGTITDVLPLQVPTNPTGVIQDSTGTHHYTARELAKAGFFPLTPPTGFYSVIFQNPGDLSWDILTFGTDSALKVTKGWDNVTGLGTPNGEAFADFFAPTSSLAAEK
jgi:subtilase family serine protease